MKLINKFHSTEDASVNFIFDNGMEARFVQRSPEYFIIYLSSQTGCNKACRFCHLTQTGQTEMVHALIDDYRTQTHDVMVHWFMKTFGLFSRYTETKIHVNFMSRGEFFSNSELLQNTSELFATIKRTIRSFVNNDMNIVFNISTIMPEEIDNLELCEIFDETLWYDGDVLRNLSYTKVRIYYSLYSMNEQFRKRWLPKAIHPKRALNKLSRFKNQFNSEVKLHWAFIEGENDSIENLKEIFDYCDEINFQPKFNLVRYNAFSPAQGKEPSEEKIMELYGYIENRLGVGNTKIISRVGTDVHASCGQFIPK
jgi:adenine C2-methylase RlmN of 23S rRNA A2503 and tRNA A37